MEMTPEQRRANMEINRIFRWYDAARVGKTTVKNAIIELQKMYKEFLTTEEAKATYEKVMLRLDDPNFEIRKNRK